MQACSSSLFHLSSPLSSSIILALSCSFFLCSDAHSHSLCWLPHKPLIPSLRLWMNFSPPPSRPVLFMERSSPPRLEDAFLHRQLYLVAILSTCATSFRLLPPDICEFGIPHVFFARTFGTIPGLESLLVPLFFLPLVAPNPIY